MPVIPIMSNEDRLSFLDIHRIRSVMYFPENSEWREKMFLSVVREIALTCLDKGESTDLIWPNLSDRDRRKQLADVVRTTDQIGVMAEVDRQRKAEHGIISGLMLQYLWAASVLDRQSATVNKAAAFTAKAAGSLGVRASARSTVLSVWKSNRDVMHLWAAEIALLDGAYDWTNDTPASGILRLLRLAEGFRVFGQSFVTSGFNGGPIIDRTRVWTPPEDLVIGSLELDAESVRGWNGGIEAWKQLKTKKVV